MKRNSVVILLGLLVIFGFNPLSALASSDEANVITTEDGKKVGIGKPKIKSVKSNLRAGNSKKNDLEYQEVINGNDLKHIITVDPSSTNVTVEIPFEFENEEYVVLTQDEEGKNNGSGNIYNKNNESIGVVSTQIIEDQENLNLDATIKNDNVLELDIETDNLQPIEIELFASATYYSTYFSSGSWITRSSDYPISLSLKHKPYLTGASNAVAADARMNDAWAKNPWNLEPGRPNLSYSKTVTAGCNPK